MSTSWCECMKCTAIPSGIECQCCKEMEGVSERMGENEINCITEQEQFKSCVFDYEYWETDWTL